MAVLLETTLGDVVIDLYTEERPRACLNFLKLCKMKYYNYCLVHNVQRDFIIQTGDPTGTGRGGESIFGQLYGDQASFFEAEKVPRIKHKKKGTVSMVNNGSDQHGSQFLITTGENLDYLDGVHTVFGEVTEGMDIVKKINETFVDKDFVPYQDIRINHTVILDDPFDDPPGLLIPDRSPEPTREQLDSGRIGADEEIDDFKGRSAEEVEEIKAEKEAKTQAILLEMVGDLPDADIKPPENVLFVCKLNPVTTDEDLEIIFSRFGPIRSCEVIRDWKTGESLCYAFIEFEKEEDCEKAFFKMDNVLIDDRRIHVDFSQSVAKVKWKGKACLNFLKLCKMKYYNYCLVHNVQRDFIIQTGDPTGTGRGGESIFGQLYGDQASFFEAEKVPRIKHKKKGTVSMVNNGSDQHGSQVRSWGGR
uniref:Peptidyl-prolyl cis-trans isomerase n=1 Tax=Castor canadensis TaxID=51338 RepID=A0A8B7UUV7_CASCN|nr:peptidyl-prolyl cis-trans isomerase-like 4 isoform X1 [Castor canadensis]